MSTMSELASPKTSSNGMLPFLYTHPNKPHLAAVSALYSCACLTMPVPRDKTRILLLSSGSICTYSESPAKIPLEMWDMAIRVCEIQSTSVSSKTSPLKLLDEKIMHRIIGCNPSINEIITGDFSSFINGFKIVCWEICRCCRGAYADIR